MAVAINEGRVPRRTCASCSDAQKHEFGCTEETEHQEHWIDLEDGTVIKRCPYAMVSARAFRLIQCASLIECGVLPDAGGWCDQAATFCAGASVVLAARAEFRKEAQR